MKQRFVLLGFVFALMLVSSCARDEQRKPAYNPKQCPFCTTNPGMCTYCNGAKKCAFCKGTGTRTTTTKSFLREGIQPVTYTEKCPFCHGSGVCRYCEGTGKCWACKGTALVESWDFFHEAVKDSSQQTKQP
jgi:DnaJ-class molecular chaperone